MSSPSATASPPVRIRCPACGKAAMTYWTKLAGRSLACRHCGARLRIRLIPTLSAALVAYLSILFAGMAFGVGETMVLVALGCLLVFLAFCLAFPLEVAHGESPGGDGC